jgi:hypothetical protein
MILRRISQHIKEQNWFAVVLDFVIVVIGVGVALAGQKWLSDYQQRQDMQKAEIAVQEDLKINYLFAKERLSFVNCRVQNYQAIAKKLLEPVEDWEALPPFPVSSSRTNALPITLRSPARSYGSRIWYAELARGTFNQMDNGRRENIDRIFNQGRKVEDLQNEILNLQGDMKYLSVATTISQEARVDFYNVLGKLDEKSVLIEIMATQMIDRIEEIGLNMSAEQRAIELERHSRILQERKANIYGDCFIPAPLPLFEPSDSTSTKL